MEKEPLGNECDEEKETKCEFEPPDGGWGWVIVAATFMTSLVVDGIIFSFGVMLPEMLDAFGAGPSQTSWIGSALAGTYLLIGPVAGALANKFGCRPISIVGSFIAAIAFISCVFATSIQYLIIAYGVFGGIGFGFIYLPSLVIIQSYFRKKRAFATGIAVCGSGIGMFIFSPLTQHLIKTYGWRGMLLIQAGIILHCAAFSGFFRPIELYQKPKLKKKCTPLLKKTKETREILFRLSDNSADEVDQKKMPTIRESSNNSNASTDTNENYSKLLTAEETAKLKNAKRLSKSVDEIKRKKKSSLSFGSKQNRRRSAIPRVTSADLMKPFFRNEMYLSGSLASIPNYEKMGGSYFSIAPDKVDGKISHMKEAIKAMLNLSLFKSITFDTLCGASFLTFLTFFVPFIYISDFAVSTGRTKEESAFLISVIGITNTVGRIFCGWVSDRPKVKALHINNGALIIAGLSTALVPFCKSYAIQLVYSTIFGLAIACYVSLRSILLVEYLGLETLTNSFGLTLLFQGTASMIGPPVAGWFYKQSDSYDLPFYVAGSIMAVSGLICVPLPCISAWEKKREEKKFLERQQTVQKSELV